MLKTSLQRLTILSLIVITVACTKKDQQKPTDGSGDTTNDSSVVAKPMDFSNAGSDSGQIPGLSTVQFEYDSSNISDSAKKQLADNADWIKKAGKVTVQIEGHCDERGSIEYNLALGERRAKSVKAYLVGLGVDAKKMTIISFGKEKKIDEGDSEPSHAKNRRANFVPMPN